MNKLLELWNWSYVLQLAAGVVIVGLHYAVGPFFEDEAIWAIGAALAVPEPLWAIVIRAIRKIVPKRDEG